MKILVVGDVVGNPGRKTLYAYLEKVKDKYDFIIVMEKMQQQVLELQLK